MGTALEPSPIPPTVIIQGRFNRLIFLQNAAMPVQSDAIC